jgi:hypothetical protein
MRPERTYSTERRIVSSTTVADVQRLQHWVVEQVFGFAGDDINGILGALHRAGNKGRFVRPRHEEMSAFEAVGYAKYGDRVGICLATSGPGVVHLPPIPPHIDLSQVKAYTSSVLHGDTNRVDMVKQGIKDERAELIR